MGRLAGSGIEMGQIAAAIDNTVLRGRALPDEIQGALRRAGIETHVGTGRVPVTHPLLQLRREIHLATPEERDPSPPRAELMPRRRRPPRLGIPIEINRPREPDLSNANVGLITPERAPQESNAQYAWRLHNLNPDVPLDRIAAAAVGPSGHLNLRPTLNQLNAIVKLHNDIQAMFGGLRSISKDDAERLGFKDAAKHGEDEATDCLFGGPLSTANTNQRIIALAQSPSDQAQPRAAGLVFLDMNQLATFLATKPEHPINRAPLNLGNLHNFAFRIE